MQRSEFITMTKRLLDHVEAGTTDMGEAPYRVPVSAYLDPERWQREMDVIFKRVPLLMALSCELPEPGTYKAMDIVGVPVLLTRADDGVARAFLNVCRHRGAQVMDHGCGNARRFTCPYHAWSYGGDGSLVGLYGKSTFGDVDMSQLGLTPLPCDEHAGMIFACVTPGTVCDAREWLAGFDEILAPFHMETWTVFSRRELEGPNWKVCYDGYLEGYHFQSLHRETIFKSVMSNVMTYDAWGPHQRVGFAKHGITALKDKPESEWEDFEGASLVCTLFPNISFAFSPDGTMLSQLIPGPTPDRSRTIQTIFSAEPLDTEEAREAAGRRSEFLYAVVRDEDYKTGLGIQRGLASGANHEFLYGRNELGLHRFHQTVDRFLADA